MEPRFGTGLVWDDFYSNRIVPRSSYHTLPTGYRRPWAIARHALKELGTDTGKMEHLYGPDGFQACVDVHHFQPSEVSVRTIDNTIVVEGKHEERDDNMGSVQRHFVRKYTLPKDYDATSVQSSLSSDGVLIIKAPLPAALESGERIVPISHTNAPVHLSIKDTRKQEKKESDTKK